MNTQQSDARIKWGYYYRLFRHGIFKDDNRHVMREYRREAALERALKAAQRKIDRLQAQVWLLEAQEHNRDDGNEWEKEYYLRGMHR